MWTVPQLTSGARTMRIGNKPAGKMSGFCFVAASLLVVGGGCGGGTEAGSNAGAGGASNTGIAGSGAGGHGATGGGSARKGAGAGNGGPEPPRAGRARGP